MPCRKYSLASCFAHLHIKYVNLKFLAVYQFWIILILLATVYRCLLSGFGSACVQLALKHFGKNATLNSILCLNYILYLCLFYKWTGLACEPASSLPYTSLFIDITPARACSLKILSIWLRRYRSCIVLILIVFSTIINFAIRTCYNKF